MSAMIQFQNVSRCYPGNIVAVQDINLTIDKANSFFCPVLPAPENQHS